ncbi:hypothetical protein H5410_027810, partial [Solanum commersonii]
MLTTRLNLLMQGSLVYSKDSNYDTLLPRILMLAILATCASSSSTKVSKCPYVFPYFPIDFRFGLLKIKKICLRLVMGLGAK